MTRSWQSERNEAIDLKEPSPRNDKHAKKRTEERRKGIGVSLPSQEERMYGDRPQDTFNVSHDF